MKCVRCFAQGRVRFSLVEVYRLISGRFVDSVVLMQIGREMERVEGARKAGCMVATEENLALFREAGFRPPPGIEANSILIAVEARDEESGNKAIQRALSLLEERSEAVTAVERYALDEIPRLVRPNDLPVLLISTSGEHVRGIGMKGLDLGLNLHVFSSNVPLDDELDLKRLGKERGLLVMGPDSGTCIIDGKGLGFSNALKGGNDVAVVGSSGTGIQELTVQLDRAGLGVSNAIDVGSRDMTKEVEGIMTKRAIEFVKHEAAMLMVVCKKPDPSLREKVIEMTKDRPSVFISLGTDDDDDDEHMVGRTFVAGIIDRAVGHALRSMGRKGSGEPVENLRPTHLIGPDGNEGRSEGSLRGYFVGGSLCYQAQAILFRMGVPVYSNAPLRPEYELHRNFGNKNVCIDTGAEEYVTGRPHPIIDPKARNSFLVQESCRDDVRVLLFDVILGYGSAEDPLEGLEGVSSRPALVASICGTDRDPQDRAEVERRLRKIGATVFGSSARAATYSAQLMKDAFGKEGTTGE